MGWFSSSSNDTDTPTSLDGTYKPMRRNERQKCWDARDAYFQCLDRHEIIDPVKDASNAAKKCPSESARFDQDCAKSWVQYFKAKRVADFEKDERIRKMEAEGAVPVSKQESKWKLW